MSKVQSAVARRPRRSPSLLTRATAHPHHGRVHAQVPGGCHGGRGGVGVSFFGAPQARELLHFYTFMQGNVRRTLLHFHGQNPKLLQKTHPMRAGPIAPISTYTRARLSSEQCPRDGCNLELDRMSSLSVSDWDVHRTHRLRSPVVVYIRYPTAHTEVRAAFN